MSNGQKDMFLKVETARQGAIKGESHDKTHQDEIDICGWSWGMQAKSGISAGGQTGKATLNEINIIKKMDSASTALMSAMRNNDVIKKAVITARKSGSEQHDYMRLTLENGRITKLDVHADVDSEIGIMETLSMSFHKIEIEYIPQGEDGRPRGGMLFSAETAKA